MHVVQVIDDFSGNTEGVLAQIKVLHRRQNVRSFEGCGEKMAAWKLFA